jgi:hypothetical protein
MLTRQEMFDTAYAGIIAQGGPATTTNGACRYRRPSGNKCAVGHLISDDKYDPDMEGTGVTNPRVYKALGDDISAEDISFLHSLQSCHDTAAAMTFPGFIGFITEFQRRVKLFCEDYELTMPE